MASRFLITALSAVMLLGAVRVLAHEDIRVIGTITKTSASAIQVKNKEGKVASIDLDKNTKITRDEKKAAPSDLKVGVSVVVDGFGDSEDDMVALEIRIVPPMAAPKK